MDDRIDERKKEAESRLAMVDPKPVQPTILEAIEEMEQQHDPAAFAQFGSLLSYIESLGLDSGFTQRQCTLLAAYARCGLLRRSCHIAGVSLQNHYYWMKNPDYAAAFEEAKKIAGEVLEQLALELASGVYEKPIASQGKIVGYEKIYDTKMLSMMMKARMPDKYQQRVDITSGGQSLVKLVDKEAWDSV